MPRQSISLTTPNDNWLKAQISSEEYNSKSELVNDLIRRARENEIIRNKLIKAEKSGFSDKSPSEMLESFKERAKQDGQL